MDTGRLVRPTIYCPNQADMDKALADVKIGKGDFATGEMSRRLNTKALIGDLISTWQVQADGRKSIVFCVDVAHSKAVCDDFLAAGVPAEQIDYRNQGRGPRSHHRPIP